ncbi:hypothetical protein JVU11DRAFT_1741 [Chiua virens]|nr:hypothetical protein JVU11DRAFT_1741 [Chiua virens]
MTVSYTSLSSEYPIAPWVVLINAIPLVVFCIFEALTVIVSLLRLAFRLKIRRLWWEDMWATIATVGTIVFAANIMLYFQTGQSSLVLRG